MREASQINQPLLIRAAYLHLYFDLFREIGVPVERALARSRLPGLIEDQPDAYVSLPLVLTWLAETGRDLTPMELGYHASGGMSVDSLDATLVGALHNAATGRVRVERYFRLMAIEDSALAPRIEPDGQNVRLVMSMPRLDSHPHACLAEWVNIKALISVVSGVAGADWSPPEITLVSHARAPLEAQEEFCNTRVLVNQPFTSVLVEAAVLAQAQVKDSCNIAASDPEVFQDKLPETWTFRSGLRAIIQPYIAEGRSDLAFAADLVGTSQRTLQRRLKNSGSTYSAIVEEARFELATLMLRQCDTKIVDVAHASGYENPQHFARAFRRLAGVSPSEYRQIATS